MKNIQYHTIDLYGVKLTLHYTTEGRYIPETRDEPAEYPEPTIHKITASDSEVDLKDLLDNYIETIYELLKEAL